MECVSYWFAQGTLRRGDPVPGALNAEWGYFSWEELKEVRLWGMEVVLDCKWTVRRFGDIGIGTIGRDGA
jgi:hypothetical protein